jgi:hypothetical protein
MIHLFDCPDLYLGEYCRGGKNGCGRGCSKEGFVEVFYFHVYSVFKRWLIDKVLDSISASYFLFS